MRAKCYRIVEESHVLRIMFAYSADILAGDDSRSVQYQWKCDVVALLERLESRNLGRRD
jgi:hypothetical protein